jgi:hypothetical protein
MNSIEDRLAAAARAVADAVPEGSAPPLRLPSSVQSAGHGLSVAGRRRFLIRILTPTMAAVAVLAVVATSLAIGRGHDSGAPHSPATDALLSAVPPYYVTLFAGPTVRDTRTGAILADVHPPTGYAFTEGAAGSDDDSFVLAAFWVNSPANRPLELYLLRYKPREHRVQLTRLKVPAIPHLAGFTLSPNGSEIAVASPGLTESQIRIYTLSGRLVRQWQHPGWICPGFNPLPCLSWSENGNLAFSWLSHNPPYVGAPRVPDTPGADGIRMLSATAPSGGLIDESRLVVHFKTPMYSSFVLSSDGTTISADVQVRGPRRPADSPVPGPLINEYEQFSAATGKLTGQFWPSAQGLIGMVYWSNQSGSNLIVRAPTPRTSRHARWMLGLLSRGRFTPFHGSAPGIIIAF